MFFEGFEKAHPCVVRMVKLQELLRHELGDGVSDEDGLEEDAEREVRAVGRVHFVHESLLSRNRQADQNVLGPGLDSGRAIGIVPQGHVQVKNFFASIRIYYLCAPMSAVCG